MNDEALSKAEKLGELIRATRKNAGRSVEESARVLGLPSDIFREIESGTYTVSLPELEVLAMYFHVPMSYFWNGELPTAEEETDYDAYRLLRQRIVAVLLRQARLQSRSSLEELSEATGIDPERLSSFESGSEPIPYFELQKLAESLDVPMHHFEGSQLGPLARHESNLKVQKNVQELPDEIRNFVGEPINLSYLQTAKRLSEMDVDKLRAIAEGILDITY